MEKARDAAWHQLKQLHTRRSKAKQTAARLGSVASCPARTLLNVLADRAAATQAFLRGRTRDGLDEAARRRHPAACLLVSLLGLVSRRCLNLLAELVFWLHLVDRGLQVVHGAAWVVASSHACVRARDDRAGQLLLGTQVHCLAVLEWVHFVSTLALLMLGLRYART